MAFLTRAEPTKNLHRFYVVRLAPTLFGEWTLLREWGRSGSPGTVRQTSFAHYDDAEKAERQIIKRRLNHGYTDRAARSKRPEHSGNTTTAK
jgi:predicted DNA-binding WGR domain protein